MGANDGSAQTRYIFEALESVRLAKFSEEQFEYENASRLYDTAVHLFITGVQKDANKERQDLVRKKLAKCLAKAEKCRAIVRSKNSNNSKIVENLDNDNDDDLLTVDKKLLDGEGGSKSVIERDFLSSSKHFSHSNNIDWPHNLNHYQLKQVITSDIWLVARLIDKNDQNLAIMVGVPRINKNQQNLAKSTNLTNSQNFSNQETLETIDTSRIPHYEIGKALSLRIAAIMYRPNRYHVTTGQKFLQEFITDISLEIRTQYTIFCIVKATKETLEYAKSVRRIVTNMRHADCKDAATNCQACQLRQTQRNIIRFSSSSSSGGSSSDDDRLLKNSKNKTKIIRNQAKNSQTKVTGRKLSQEEVRKSLAKKNLQSESGLSSGSPMISKNNENIDQKINKSRSLTNLQSQVQPSTNNSSKFHISQPNNKRRVSTPIIVLNSNKIKEKTRAYENKKRMINSNSDKESNEGLSVTPTTSGICTTASSSNNTSRCASSESNASTQKPAEERTVKDQKVSRNEFKCDEVIDLVEQAGKLVIDH